MFITENQSLLESLNFLVCARASLMEMIKSSSVENKDGLINFLQNEASDYEIMHLLVRGDLPDKKFNHADEIRLFSDLKEQIILAYPQLLEHFDHSVLNSFLYEVDSVYPNYSSAKPILEHLSLVSEFDPGAPDPGKVTRGASKDWTPEIEALKGVGKTALETWEKIGSGARKLIAQAAQAGKDAAAKAKAIDSIMQKGFSPKEALKIYNQQQSLLKKVGDASKYLNASFMGKALSAVGGAAIKGAQKAGELAQKAGAGKVTAKAGELAGKGSEEVAKWARRGGHQNVLAAMDKIKAGATAAAPAIQKALQDPALVGAGIAASALSALALYGSNKLYKRFMSKAARACAGKSGGEKTQCMKQYKVQGIKAQIADLQKAAGACAKAKKPDKCRAPIMKKIAKLQKKAQSAAK
jgi:hypothetical protein